MDWYLPGAKNPNGINKYKRQHDSPGPGWIQGPPRKEGTSKWMKYTHGIIEEATQAEFDEWWVTPSQQKDAAMQALQNSLNSLPGIVLNGTPEEIQQTVDQKLNEISDFPTAKAALKDLLPVVGLCIGCMRDLLLYLRDAKNG